MITLRPIRNVIETDLEEKMVFISGPRQVGKTTLAKTFLTGNEDRYFNWDHRGHRKKILSGRWPAGQSTVVLDELHKYVRWKQYIKGEYDVHGNRIRFLVTGSARLDIYRKGGDSLQGRYHAHRLHGFSVGELQKNQPLPEPGKEIVFPDKRDSDVITALLHYGPFPEPFLKQDERAARRWRRERLDRFFREDVRDLENVRDISSMEILADMLEDRAGGLLSLQSLREDLEVSHKAVTHWMDILDRLYFSFRIPPFTHRKYRSLKKMPKVYLWDWASVPNRGARFENLTACHLLKLKHALEDQEGWRIGLHYLRDVDKREVDFLLTAEGKPWFAVECKTKDRSVNPSLNYFGDRVGIPWLYQLTLDEGDDILAGNVRVMPAAKFFSALP
ncbi:MAG: ATP-binding protein [Proteobacteria bacterium]|nr:ATP-binding protein [Pseudomonadota bacterium]